MNVPDSMSYAAPCITPRASEYAPVEPHDYLWNQLAKLPYFRALLRAVESRFYGQLPVVAPVLDLGAGDGSFSAQTFSRPLDAGIDPWWSATVEARKLRAHRVLALAQGAVLPFAENSFQTVVSNSVLEHIPDLDPVISEAHRVLRPGGYLLFCAPSEHFTDWLAGAQVFGDSYRRWFNRISRHAHCDSPDQWKARLTQAGFITEHIWYYFSPKALRTLELGHYLGLPNLLSKKLFGKWVVWPSRKNPILRLIYATLKPLYNEPLPVVGAYLFGVARKP